MTRPLFHLDAIATPDIDPNDARRIGASDYLRRAFNEGAVRVPDWPSAAVDDGEAA